MRVNTPVRVNLKFDGEDPVYNYVGEAPLNTTTDEPYWRIYRLTNSGASLSKDWADGSDQFNKIWDDRTFYTY